MRVGSNWRACLGGALALMAQLCLAAYSFDDSERFAAATDWPAFAAMLERHHGAAAELAACRADAEDCPAHFKRVRVVLERGAALTREQQLRLVNRFVNKRRYAHDRPRRIAGTGGGTRRDWRGSRSPGDSSWPNRRAGGGGPDLGLVGFGDAALGVAEHFTDRAGAAADQRGIAGEVHQRVDQRRDMGLGEGGLDGGVIGLDGLERILHACDRLRKLAPMLAQAAVSLGAGGRGR